MQKFRLDSHRKGKGEGQERERGEIAPRKSVLGNRIKSGGVPRDVSTDLISALDSGKGGSTTQKSGLCSSHVTPGSKAHALTELLY